MAKQKTSIINLPFRHFRTIANHLRCHADETWNKVFLINRVKDQLREGFLGEKARILITPLVRAQKNRR